MNLVAFSIRTKGLHNFARRLWTVFIRFGISETRTRRALHTIINTLRKYRGTPTFFIPAVVLGRHPGLITEIANAGAEIGIHGYVHNDYRTLGKEEQYRQTKQAISVFQRTRIPYQGFRNPYLGWTEESLNVFTELGFTYETTSIPDDEIVFDRLRITDAGEVGDIWCRIMRRVYDLGGLYVLNLHPERGILCKQALDKLLSYASNQAPPVWVTCLKDIAQWWQERCRSRLNITQLASDRWRVEASCTSRATLLARHLIVEDQPATPWSATEVQVHAHYCTVNAPRCPCIGLSPHTPQQVLDFLLEQGYPAMRCSQEASHNMYTLYLDLAEGLGTTREEQLQRRSALVRQIEDIDTPFLRFGCWPDGTQAALAISGDIDSVTVQDFFLRILEVH